MSKAASAARSARLADITPGRLGLPSSSSPSTRKTISAGRSETRRAEASASKKEGERTLGIGGAPRHDAGSRSWHIGRNRGKRRRGPSRLIGRLHIVHPVAQEPGAVAFDAAQDRGVPGRGYYLGAPAGALDECRRRTRRRRACRRPKRRRWDTGRKLRISSRCSSKSSSIRSHTGAQRASVPPPFTTRILRYGEAVALRLPRRAPVLGSRPRGLILIISL